jgi:diaminohydroxyphosphoribosylaminopyrimidine deaminase/5-amino-6-(5-phosphoribosylamino)uracil reductase
VATNPQDEAMMEHALSLAEASVGLASPNPQVGCVLVREGQVIGEGAHHFDAFDHAEIVALKQSQAAGIDPRGATAYVTLEPCCHQGRTGPCADALIAAGIARCVVATVDPNPRVSGQGIERMRAAGIGVETGVGQERARRLNNAFAYSITAGRPFVTLKAALSVDGRLAPEAATRRANEPFWLTGAEARAEVQRLRHGSDAILTGIGTVLADDPLLTDRTGRPRRKPLMRVVLDSRLRIPANAKLLQNPPQDLRIFCAPEAPMERRAELASLGVRVTEVGVARSTSDEMLPTLDLVEVLRHLHEAGIVSVLLEGGSALNGAFLRGQLVDQAILFYAETELGPDSVPFAEGFPGPFAVEEHMLSVNQRTFGSDVCVSGLLHDPWRGLPDVG